MQAQFTITWDSAKNIILNTLISEKIHFWFQAQDHMMSVNNASSYQFDFVSFIILMYNMVLITVYREDSKVLFIGYVFCLLAHESCDISQTETKISLVKSWTNSQQITAIFTQITDFFSNLTILTEKKSIGSALKNNYFCLSLRWITWCMSQQPKTNTHVKQLKPKLLFSCWGTFNSFLPRWP